MQIIEHSDICEEFKKKYGSVKVFRRKFYAHITEKEINIEQIQIKIQIRFDKSTLSYTNYTKEHWKSQIWRKNDIGTFWAILNKKEKAKSVENAGLRRMYWKTISKVPIL